jgi:hypothetical protein
VNYASTLLAMWRKFVKQADVTTLAEMRRLHPEHIDK